MVRPIALALLLVLAAAHARAQAEAQEADAFAADLLRYRSFFDYGGFEPSLDTLLPKGPASRWTLRASVDGEYSDNVDQDASRQRGFSVAGGAGIGWLRTSPRLRASVDYRYRTDLYQSSAVSDRDGSSHTAAGTVRWQASPALTVSGGGHWTQNLEQGLTGALPGVRSGYDNRSDEYGARAEYAWRVSRRVSTDGSYSLTYRDFVDEDADGEDSRIHRGRLGVAFDATAGDRVSLAYSAVAQRAEGDDDRQTYGADLSWAHTFASFPGNRRSTLTGSYGAERGLYEDGDDYWSHRVGLGYSFPVGPQTEAGLDAGYRWIFPDGGGTEQGWNLGARVSHRFSEYTTGRLAGSRTVEYLPEGGDARTAWNYSAGLDHRFTRYTTVDLSASQGWEWAPSTTRSDAETFTRTRRVAGRLRSRLAEHVTAAADATYLAGNPEDRGAYWQTGAGASLTWEPRPRELTGVRYDALRRGTDDSPEDYLLHRGSVFHRRALLGWLDLELRYAHERRAYDGGADSLGDYHENRVSGGLTASW